MTNPNYIKPPLGENCTWRSGPPPEVGWWPASVLRDPNWIRHWDGEHWSVGAHSRNGVGDDPDTLTLIPEHESRACGILWTDRWWGK